MKRAVVVTVMLAALALVAGPVLVVAPATTVQAACTAKDASGKPIAPDSSGNCPVDPFKPKDACVKIALPIFGNNKCIDNTAEGGAIVAYTKLILKFLGYGIGLVIILMIVIAGIQYIISMGDPTNIKSAKSRLTNAVTALILYVLMFAIINFLVPGGILL